MSIELMLTQVLKEIGTLEHRLASVEDVLYGESDDDPCECDDSNCNCNTEYAKRFSYPMEASKVTEASTNHFRYIKNSMYKVYIAKPHLDPDDPDSHTIMEVDMNRDELDNWIANSPAESNGEYIYKLIPSLDQHL